MQAWSAPPFLRVGGPPAADTVVRCRLFDTATQSLRPAGPASGTARMYICGITPYDATHMGHANTYVAFDLLHRTWLDAGLDVRYVQNVTDVDDPLLERAAAMGVDWSQLAQDQTQLFREDMSALNVLPPTDYVGAVETIPLVADLIAELQDRGAVYPVDDPEFADLYFAEASDAEFGSLSHLDEADALSLFAARGGDPQREGKKHPLDCLVWRLHREGEPGWDSVLGKGRPGWHIECTAIALHLLGTDFDVQGGGRDLIFPHHEMCAAEGRVASGQPFAKLFAHSGMVGLDGEKMSKSKGNLVLVSRLRAAGVDPMAIRLTLISHHYREDWSWSQDELTDSERRLGLWRDAVQLGATLNADEVISTMRTAMASDLDAPAAVAAVDAWAAAALTVDGDDVDAPALVAQACDSLLGVRLG